MCRFHREMVHCGSRSGHTGPDCREFGWVAPGALCGGRVKNQTKSWQFPQRAATTPGRQCLIDLGHQSHRRLRPRSCGLPGMDRGHSGAATRGQLGAGGPIRGTTRPSCQDCSWVVVVNGGGVSHADADLIHAKLGILEEATSSVCESPYLHPTDGRRYRCVGHQGAAACGMAPTSPPTSSHS